MRLRRISSVLIVLSIFAFASFASADITPALASVTPSGSNFSWNYTAAVDSNEDVISGSSYFTIYDIAGFVSTTAPAGWSFTTQLVGVTPSSQLLTDDPTLINVTFDYTGGGSILGPQFALGPFTIISSTNSANLGGVFSYQAGKKTGGTDQGQGPLSVPSVPEGSELSMLGISGIAMLSAMKRKFVS
jgi:hypothetical protein